MTNQKTTRAGLTRRHILQGGAALSAMSLFAGAPARAQENTVRFAIYGSADKLEIREESINHFKELFPDVHVVYEGVASAAWPDKIAAMIAGGNAPDVITLSRQHQVQYGAKGVLEPLENYDLHLDLFPPAVLELGKVNGVLYGLPIAVAVQALGYNRSALERLGMELPASFSYAEFAEFCAEIHKRDANLYGSHDQGGRLQDLQRVLAAEDRALVVDNKLNISAEEMADWLNYWDKMRKSGGAVPADIQAAFIDGEWQNSPMVLGKAVFSSIQTQDLKSGYQALMQDETAMTAPQSWVQGGHNGVYPNPSSSLTMNAASTLKENAAKVMDYFVNSPESGKILGLISGPPASTAALAAVKELPDLDRLDRNTLEYAEAALKTAKPAPNVHAAETALRDLIKRVNEDVGFGRASAQQAAEDFIAQGNDEIQRA
jgi:multiple sugar transport system substrate-binding protein